MISSVDLAHYGLSNANDLVSVDCGTNSFGLANIYAENTLTLHSS